MKQTNIEVNIGSESKNNRNKYNQSIKAKYTNVGDVFIKLRKQMSHASSQFNTSLHTLALGSYRPVDKISVIGNKYIPREKNTHCISNVP